MNHYGLNASAENKKKACGQIVAGCVNKLPIREGETTSPNGKRSKIPAGCNLFNCFGLRKSLG